MARILVDETRRESRAGRAAPAVQPADAYAWPAGIARVRPGVSPLPGGVVRRQSVTDDAGAQPASPVPNPQPAADTAPAAAPADAAAQGTTATADAPAPHLAVVPNDRAQQEALLPRPDLEALFDTRIAPLLASVVSDRSRALAPGVAERRHREAVRAANQRVDRDLADLRRAAGGRGPTRAVASRLRQEAVRAVVRETVDPATLDAGELARYRTIFLERGGNVMDARGGGYRNLRTRLRNEEQQLVARLRRSTRRQPAATPEEIQRQVHQLRLDYQARLADTIDRMVERFPVLARAELRSQFEPQPGVRALRGFTRPAAGREPTVPAAGGAWESSSARHQVGESLHRWVEHLRTSQPQAFGAGTYHGHSWGEYSVDVTLSGTRVTDGFYPRQAAIDFLLAADASARATGVEWRALYNDFEVAREVNRQLGERRVTFQWHHGPAPYVLHFHFDIMPRNLPASMDAGEMACIDPARMVCEGDEPLATVPEEEPVSRPEE